MGLIKCEAVLLRMQLPRRALWRRHDQSR
jgi:hypothetical protein